MKLTTNSNSTIFLLLMFLVEIISTLISSLPIDISEIIIYSVALILFFSSKSGIKSEYSNDIFWSLVSLYLFLLFIRLLVDFIIPGKGFFLYKKSSTIVFFFLMTMVIPFLIYKKTFSNINLSTWVIVAGIFISINLAVSFNDIINHRAVENVNTGQFSGSGNMSISAYGHYGVSLFLMGVYILINNFQKYYKLLSILFVALGLSAVVMSGSRSPFVALVCCFILLMVTKYSKWYHLAIVLVLVFFYGNIFETSIIDFNDYLVSEGYYGFSRVVNSFFGLNQELSTSGRDLIFNYAIELFKSNPITGTSYLLPDGSYVHNIFIEQFMALGVLGGLLFVIINIKALVAGWKMIHILPQYSIFYVLFIQYMIYGCFSKTIIALAPYWLFMFVTMNIYNNRERIC